MPPSPLHHRDQPGPVVVTYSRWSCISRKTIWSFCVCSSILETAMHQCWQYTYLPHPQNPYTHTCAHTDFGSLCGFKASFLRLLCSPLQAGLTSSLVCKPALLCHQDYRPCCSRLMTDNSTFLSALRGTHRVTRTGACAWLWSREEQLRGR